MRTSNALEGEACLVTNRLYVIVFLWICNKECKLPNRASVRSSSNIVYSRYGYRSTRKTLLVVG